MRSPPNTGREIVASLQHQVIRAQADGLSRMQAIAAVAHRHNVSPVKVNALLHLPERREHA